MNILALLLLGTLTGNEIAILVFVHPVLSRLPDAVHAASTQGLARIYGKYAPFWYTATVLMLGGLAWGTSSNQPSKAALTTSVLLFIGALVFSLIGPVPINTRVSQWDLNELPQNWKQERARWDTLHAIRVGILLLSLLALIIGTIRT